MTWAQGILTLQPGVSALIADVPLIFKLHLFLGMTIFLLFPFTRLVHVWSAPIWYLGRRGYQVVRTRAAGWFGGRRNDDLFGPRPNSRRQAGRVSVNGVAIARDAIVREMQHHAAAKPIAAWQQAARALVIRELLMQQARHLGVTPEPISDDEGRRETDEKRSCAADRARGHCAASRTTRPAAAIYDVNQRAFPFTRHLRGRAHPVRRAAGRRAGYAQARADAGRAGRLAAKIRKGLPRWRRPIRAARRPEQGGNLGQITTGQTTPEFEQALIALAPGQLCEAPVATRYGFHIIRLERKHEGQTLPYEAVAGASPIICATACDSARTRNTSRGWYRRRRSRDRLAGADALRVH